DADVFTNTGTVGATNNGLLTLNRAWSNTGTLEENNATLNLGGTFTTAAIGTFSRVASTVNLIGELDNTGATFMLNASTGSWTINAGSITGGTVALSGGATLGLSSNPNNRLTGVTVNGNLSFFANSATLRIRDSLTLNGVATISGPSARLVFDNTS